MSKQNAESEQKLTTNKMLDELPIKIQQLRLYISDGRLKVNKVRNRLYATREDFDDFKLRLGF